MAKILIIDDDADLVKTLSLLLERTGDDIVASRLSATPSTHWVDREMEAEHYVKKPIEPDELVRSIETILRKAEVVLRSLTSSMKKL
jgi:DNA-binding response OmpR family regulator